MLRKLKHWKVPQGPADPIFGVTEAFKRDLNPKKINLGVGAYRDNKNAPHLLPSVIKSELLIKTMPLKKEYLPISGSDAFRKLSGALAYGSSCPADLIASAQTLSGTGALRVGGEFLTRFFEGAGGKTIYLPTPTWGNHIPIFRDAGLTVAQYRYFDKKTNAPPATSPL